MALTLALAETLGSKTAIFPNMHLPWSGPMH
jgi:hypothetical protein